MTEDVRKALEWFSGTRPTYDAPIDAISDADFAYGKALAAEVRRREGETCDGCRESFVEMAPAGRPHRQMCRLTRQPTDHAQTYVECITLGHGCRAWQPREQKGQGQ
jgi:hypothetical protein